MRIDLKVPFAEKDAAKALGARWDADRKIWYVKDVADLTAFMRWIPDLKAATGGPKLQATDIGNATAKLADGIMPGPATLAPHCGCNVLPWQDCEHTRSP
ncbi:MAG: DUF5710 domain-containing protein [Gallionella sp.]|nr:DUF5710 domain-containing protein [Gallionella sp.]